MSGADAVGILFLLVVWASVMTLIGVWLGRIITRRNRKR